ncbi:V-ATPase subunit H [Gracilaria domingensis]|nr:V-ATPase subunit H [Gracilaria domingensis]
MAPATRPLSSSPWTVRSAYASQRVRSFVCVIAFCAVHSDIIFPFDVLVVNGTSLSYEDATQLDKLEYALGVSPSSVNRYLAQDGAVRGISCLHLSPSLTTLQLLLPPSDQGALSEAANVITTAEAHVRAGKLLSAVSDYVTSKSRASAYEHFVAGLGDSLFTSFVAALENEKEVSSWYLAALGPILGSRSLVTYAKSTGKQAEIEQQKHAFVTAAAEILAAITTESLLASNEDDEQEDPESTSAALPLTSQPGMPSVSISSIASGRGYIPTVADIGAPVPQGYASAGDEQLGRILSGVSRFLSTDQNRYLLCQVKPPCGRVPSVLAGLLDKDVGMPVQVAYQAIFCLWLLSFVSQQDSSSAAMEAISDALEEAAVPRRLTHVLRDIWAEKVVRVSLATLRNMLNMSSTLRKEMVGAGLVNAIQSLCFRRWNDDDIRDDLSVVAEALQSELSSMSNFDVYRAEVLSGALEWTPAHTDDSFWEENAEKLERNKQEVLRCLVRLLQQSNEETVLAVACNDLAQFIKHNPRGRIIAQSLGVKGRLMELMVTGEGEVRRYALNCVQVLLIRWNRQES